MTPAENEAVAEVGMRVESIVRRVVAEQAVVDARGKIPLPISFLAMLKSELVGVYELLAELPIEVEVTA